jgi:hypothetical protein
VHVVDGGQLEWVIGRSRVRWQCGLRRPGLEPGPPVRDQPRA